MVWESEFQESLALQSERDMKAVTQALQMELQSNSSDSKSWLDKQTASAELGGPKSEDKAERWDPIMTSLLKASNAEPRPSYSNSYLASVNSGSSMQLGGLQHSRVFPDEGKSSTLVGTGLDSNLASATSPALNAPSSVGAAATKVNKKRSRASRKPPTTVLEADSANFRSMVQHLTGIPSPPPMVPSSLHQNRFDFLGSGLVRPQPSRPLSVSGQGFSTLDGALLQFASNQSPYNFRKLDSFPYVSARGGYLNPVNAADRGVFNNLRVDSPSVITPQSVSTSQALYAPQTGIPNASGLSMPSLWECEAREGENLNARIKREVGVEEGSGRQIASWSTSL